MRALVWIHEPKQRGQVSLCSECKFFVPDLPAGDVGDCRRYPPGAYIEGDFEVTWTKYEFPDVRSDDWCGEFQPKEVQQ